MSAQKAICRAKFRLNQRVEEEDGFTMHFAPVTSGSEENERFFRYTPFGELKMGTVNAAAAKQFEVGKEYYLDFTPAD